MLWRACLVVAGTASVSRCGHDNRAPTPPDPPAILNVSCPAGQMAESLDGAPTQVPLPAPVVTGGTAPVNVTCLPTFGTPFAVGTTPVSCTAVDSAQVAAACSFPVVVTAAPRLTISTIMAFGDSQTEGKLSSLNPLIEFPDSYTSVLRVLLAARYPRQVVTVSNQGYGGEMVTSTDPELGLPRFKAAVRSEVPQVVLLMEGANDLAANVSPKDLARGLADMVSFARSNGATVFLATIAPQHPPKGTGGPTVDAANSLIRAMAAPGVNVVDVFAGLGGEPANNLLIGADGIHLTPAGYQEVGQQFFAAIQQVFEKPAGSF
ncbi:MAG: SGNH/GDSL hydrolase family protein [Acidobacteriota bacterium]